VQVQRLDPALGAVRFSVCGGAAQNAFLTQSSRFHNNSYIPLRVDYTDLFDIMAFFTGDLEGRNAHPELGKQIADNGKEYADKYWRYADMETCECLSECRDIQIAVGRVADYGGLGAVQISSECCSSGRALAVRSESFLSSRSRETNVDHSGQPTTDLRWITPVRARKGHLEADLRTKKN
jgi:hypothetical protein